MRNASLLAAAILVAACQVNIEGAPCAQPGKTADCPTGQACGNDRKCSTRAAECVGAATFCTPGITGHRCRAQSSAIEACTGADAVCGSWAAENDCATSGLVCDDSKGTPACVCAVPSSEISVDVAAPQGSLAPTGAAQPPECRFRKLGEALAAAAAAGGARTVKPVASAGANVVFTGEALPLLVAPNVTLSAADPPAGATVIQGDAGTAGAMVTLQGKLERVHLQNVSMSGNGVDMTCGPTGSPTLRDVIVSADTQLLANGVSIAGSCGALLERVDISGASGVGLGITVPAATVVTVNGSWIHGNATGIEVSGGKLGLFADGSTGAPTRVTDNAGPGILLFGTTAIEASLANVVVARNGGTGVYVNQIPPESRVTMVSCDVHSNGTAAPQVYGPAPQRRAGGVLLTQPSLLTFLLVGSRIYANDGGSGADQVAFYSTGAWKVNTDSCASANAFGCVGTGLAVNVTSGSVDARNSIWSVISPPVGAGVTWSPECAGTAPSCPP